MIKTEFKPQEWVLEETGEADVYRIVKADNSDWIAVLRCNAIHNPGFQSGDGVTNVKAMVAAPELIDACIESLSALKSGYIEQRAKATELIYKALKKATE
jgi:hypothetical protein